jgi:hypothetical protein
MDDEAMGETRPLFGRQQPVKIPLDLIGIVLAGEIQTARQPFAMRVNDNPGLAESMTENHIGGFSSYPRKPGSSSIVGGTFPPNSSISWRAHSFSDLALARKRPKLRMIRSISAVAASARLSGSG